MKQSDPTNSYQYKTKRTNRKNVKEVKPKKKTNATEQRRELL